MSHHIYHTRGVILSSSPTGESNRFYKIFTEELGLVSAHAQAVREGKSKLRYVLQENSFVTIDLVRGKEMWRIISAGAHRPLDNIKNNATQLKLFTHFCALLARLVQGEGRDQELFDETQRVADFLEKNVLSQDLALSFETLVALRLLVHLGYINSKGYENFLHVNPYSIEILVEFEIIRIHTLSKINEAFNASHL